MDEHNQNHIRTSVVITMCFLLLTTLPRSQSQPPLAVDYSLCKEQSYNCGDLSVFFKPVSEQNRSSQCSGRDTFQLSCHDDNTIASQDFTVEKINNSTHTMTVLPTDPLDDVCSPQFWETYENLNRTLFQYSASEHYITIFYDDCPLISGFHSGRNFTCEGNAMYYFEEEYNYKLQDLLKDFPALDNCKLRLHVPTVAPLDGGGVDALKKALKEGFELNYDVPPPHCTRCSQNDGNCESSEHVVSCYFCPPQSDSLDYCSPPKTKNKWSWKVKVIVGVVSGVVGALAVAIGVYIFNRRKNKSYARTYVQSRSLPSDPSLKDTEKGTRSFIPGVPLFSYEELEEATNYFDSSKELGEGGFGTVYLGKLRDGRYVAVKRLYENNYKRVEQFMNEINILAGLKHQNLVSLYGCTSRHSRELLLVYEYISNGTVADHIHGQGSKSGKLPWDIRMNIALETASALEFLHLNDIIHRDVKTNNILLDDNFCVKVADFGLSRLFPDHVTHVSTAPQGTPGYVDPEYHECYQLTDKSDVYSFGVVLVELISSLPAVDITRHRHEINLANMAMNKIRNQELHELVDHTLGFDSDFKVRKMINAVAELAFQCLQSSKEDRPSMEEVVDTLMDIKSDGKHKSQPEVMDMSSTAEDVVLLKVDPPPPSPDSKAVSKSTTPNASG